MILRGNCNTKIVVEMCNILSHQLDLSENVGCIPNEIAI